VDHECAVPSAGIRLTGWLTLKLEGCEKAKVALAMRAGSVGFSASGGRPLILAVLCVGGGGRLLYHAVVVVAECERCRLREVKTQGGRLSAKAS
jgi:hypothetical protein